MALLDRTVGARQREEPRGLAIAQLPLPSCLLLTMSIVREHEALNRQAPQQAHTL
jgi:hypothetical protein